MPMMLDPQSNRKGIGLGLGLVIADALVSCFNGKLSFVSRENFGSTFNFTFKLDRERSDFSQISKIQSFQNSIVSDEDQIVQPDIQPCGEV